MEKGIITEDDADDYDPGGTGNGAPIPGDIPAEPGFVAIFSNRSHALFTDEQHRFDEFESIV